MGDIVNIFLNEFFFVLLEIVLNFCLNEVFYVCIFFCKGVVLVIYYFDIFFYVFDFYVRNM